MSDLSYSPDQSGQNGVCFLRDSIVEEGMLRLVQNYLGFCKSIDVDAPIWMFSALIDCEGVRIYTDWGFRGALDLGVDRSPCYLPEIEITLLNEKPQALLRPWCDMLWQACGMERSFKSIRMKCDGR